jgi:hypothetical protein
MRTINEQNQGDIKTTASAQYSEEEKEAMKTCILEHYIKHQKTVLRKLQLAQKATIDTFKQSDNVSQYIDDKGKDAEDLIAEHEERWEEDIQTFIESRVSEEALEQIDQALLTIPAKIKKSFDNLVQAETQLVELLSELYSDEYQEAMKIVKQMKSEGSSVNKKGAEGGKEYTIKAVRSLSPEQGLQIVPGKAGGKKKRAGGSNSMID